MWDVLSKVTNLYGIFCLRWQICVGCFISSGKSVWDVLSKVSNLCGMFCLRWQICVGCFV